MDNRPIIALFEENELNIAALYSLYAQKLPANEVFWSRLSNEEIGHAAKIGNEKSVTENIKENKFSRGVTKYIMNFVLDEIKKTQNEDVTHEYATNTALRIERSMLEKKCFDMFTPTNETLKNVLVRLNSDTERHVEMLLREMKKNKFDFE